MKIELVTIDFWNTIYDSSNNDLRDNFRNNAVMEVAANQNHQISGEELKRAVTETWRYFGHHWKKNHRTPQAKECVTHLFSDLNLIHHKKDIDYITDIFINSVAAHPPVLLANAKETIIELKKNYKIALISDTGFSPGTILKKVITNDGLSDYFDYYSFSDETGVSKPHSKAFSLPIQHLQSQAKHSIHIGDIENTDIVGAKRIGMKAIRFLGDRNNKINLENTKETLADFEVHSWKEVSGILL